MSRTLNFIVGSVRTEHVNVTKFGQEEPDVVQGRTQVEFSNGGDSFDLEWTWRGEPPAVGSHWTLAEGPA